MPFACSQLSVAIALLLAVPSVLTISGPRHHRHRAMHQRPSPTDTASTAGLAARAAPGGPMDIPGQWWTLFHSEPLNGLIDDALKHNADIEAAHAALQAAWESVYAQRGAYFPTVKASANSTRQNDANDVASGAGIERRPVHAHHRAGQRVLYARHLGRQPSAGGVAGGAGQCTALSAGGDVSQLDQQCREHGDPGSIAARADRTDAEDHRRSRRRSSPR